MIGSSFFNFISEFANNFLECGKDFIKWILIIVNFFINFNFIGWIQDMITIKIYIFNVNFWIYWIDISVILLILFFIIILSIFLPNKPKLIKNLHTISVFFVIIYFNTALWQYYYNFKHIINNTLYYNINTGIFYKLFIFLITIFLIIFLIGIIDIFFSKENAKMEYVFIIISIYLSSIILLHYLDFITIILIIECIAFSSYILVGFERKNKLSVSSSLKYLVTASIPSGFFILGIILIYTNYGSFNFFELTNLLRNIVKSNSIESWKDWPFIFYNYLELINVSFDDFGLYNYKEILSTMVRYNHRTNIFTTSINISLVYEYNVLSYILDANVFNFKKDIYKILILNYFDLIFWYLCLIELFLEKNFELIFGYSIIMKIYNLILTTKNEEDMLLELVDGFKYNLSLFDSLDILAFNYFGPKNNNTLSWYSNNTYNSILKKENFDNDVYIYELITNPYNFKGDSKCFYDFNLSVLGRLYDLNLSVLGQEEYAFQDSCRQIVKFKGKAWELFFDTEKFFNKLISDFILMHQYFMLIMDKTYNLYESYLISIMETQSFRMHYAKIHDYFFQDNAIMINNLCELKEKRLWKDFFQNNISPILYLGLFLICFNLFFKITGAPFHIWAPTIYGGSPLATVSFLSIFSKIVIFFLCAFFIFDLFDYEKTMWQSLFMLIGSASLGFSILGAFKEKLIKRFFVYSSMGHVGYIICGLSSSSVIGVECAFEYLLVYTISSIMIWFIVMFLQTKNVNIVNFKGLAFNHKELSFIYALILFSFAGLPPMGGFYVKYEILTCLLASKLYFLTYILLLLTVISFYYYIRLIKVIYFEDNVNFLKRRTWDDFKLRIISFLIFLIPLYSLYIEFPMIYSFIKIIKNSF